MLPGATTTSAGWIYHARYSNCQQECKIGQGYCRRLRPQSVSCLEGIFLKEKCKGGYFANISLQSLLTISTSPANELSRVELCLNGFKNHNTLYCVHPSIRILYIHISEENSGKKITRKLFQFVYLNERSAWK